MPKKPENHRKSWTPTQETQLRIEAASNTPTRVIALHLKRTPDAIEAKAQELNVSLAPWNQRPYGTRKR